MNKLVIGGIVGGVVFVGAVIGTVIVRKRKAKKVADFESAMASEAEYVPNPELVAEANQLRAEHSFGKRWDEVTASISFDPAWHNGTGYFDHASKVDLPVGSIYRSTDECGRRLLLIGTVQGTLVLFERYSQGWEIYAIAVSGKHEARRLITEHCNDSRLSSDGLNEVIRQLVN